MNAATSFKLFVLKKTSDNACKLLARESKVSMNSYKTLHETKE